MKDNNTEGLMEQQNMSDEEKALERQRQRVSLTIRFNGAQMKALHKVFFQLQDPHLSLSEIVRRATVVYLAREYSLQVPMELNYYDENQA
jgi:hypothetical protein